VSPPASTLTIPTSPDPNRPHPTQPDPPDLIPLDITLTLLCSQPDLILPDLTLLQFALPILTHFYPIPSYSTASFFFFPTCLALSQLTLFYPIMCLIPKPFLLYPTLLYSDKYHSTHHPRCQNSYCLSIGRLSE